MRVGIFGGTFNPIHTGHVLLINRMKKALQIDELIVVPTLIPPHKSNGDVIGSHHRLQMCRLATESLDGVTVSDIELRRENASYTIDTIHQLKVNRRCDEFILLMGSDMLFTFASWKNAQEIMKLVKIAAIARENDELDKMYAEKENLEKLGGIVEIVDDKAFVASSTAIRNKIAMEEDVPQNVMSYIEQNGLYGYKKVLPVDDKNIKALLKEKLSEKRYLHSLNVADEAAKLAEYYNEDSEIAYMAGLLHDICKEMPKDDMLNLLSGSDILSDDVFKSSPQIWHGFAAANYIQRELELLNTEIIDAVRYHSTASGHMSKIGEIIYIADLISIDRNYPELEKLREIAYRSLEEAMLESMAFIVSDLANKKRPALNDTLEAYNRYALLVRGMR